MRIVEFIQVIGGLLGSIASIALAFEQKFINRLKKENALSEKSAIDFSTGNPLLRWRIKRLKKENSIIATTENKYYFNHNGYLQYRNKRRKRALIVILVILLIFFPSLFSKFF